MTTESTSLRSIRVSSLRTSSMLSCIFHTTSSRVFEYVQHGWVGDETKKEQIKHEYCMVNENQPVTISSSHIPASVGMFDRRRKGETVRIYLNDSRWNVSKKREKDIVHVPKHRLDRCCGYHNWNNSLLRIPNSNQARNWDQAHPSYLGRPLVLTWWGVITE